MAYTEDMEKKPVKATQLNVWVLAHTFKNTERVSGRVSSVDAPHLRRCLQAGLMSAEGNELVLTEAGKAALAA